jgi:hypothetical protein
MKYIFACPKNIDHNDFNKIFKNNNNTIIYQGSIFDFVDYCSLESSAFVIPMTASGELLENSTISEFGHFIPDLILKNIDKMNQYECASIGSAYFINNSDDKYKLITTIITEYNTNIIEKNSIYWAYLGIKKLIEKYNIYFEKGIDTLLIPYLLTSNSDISFKSYSEQLHDGHKSSKTNGNDLAPGNPFLYWNEKCIKKIKY